MRTGAQRGTQGQNEPAAKQNPANSFASWIAMPTSRPSDCARISATIATRKHAEDHALAVNNRSKDLRTMHRFSG